MPKRTDIQSILIIGAGPIVIGQACEFDYSGAQACKALGEEGFGALEAIELLERKMLVRSREGVRPFELMVGFTGYLLSARKVLQSASTNGSSTPRDGPETPSS